MAALKAFVLWVAGFARIARSGTSPSAVCAISAMGSAPRRVSSRAVCRTHGAMIRTAPNPIRTIRGT